MDWVRIWGELAGGLDEGLGYEEVMRRGKKWSWEKKERWRRRVVGEKVTIYKYQLLPFIYHLLFIIL